MGTAPVDAPGWLLRSAELAPVARQRPNARGLYDTRGNVAEWLDPPARAAVPGAGPRAEPEPVDVASPGRGLRLIRSLGVDADR